MKKVFYFFLVALILMIPAVALADNGVVASPEFFTWEMLATYAGAVLATALIVQLTKGIGFIDTIPTRIYSYAIAVIVLLLATFFTGTMSWSQGALCLINAVVVSLASNGAFDAVAAKGDE